MIRPEDSLKYHVYLLPDVFCFIWNWVGLRLVFKSLVKRSLSSECLTGEENKTPETHGTTRD